jgi:hypothetical protein
VVAEEVILLGGRAGEASAGAGEQASGPVSMPRTAQRQAPASAPAESLNQEITDDDVPF